MKQFYFQNSKIFAKTSYLKFNYPQKLIKDFRFFILSFLAVSSLFMSCNSETETVLIKQNTDLQINQFKLDTIWLEPPVYSGVGMFHVYKDTIFLFDKILGTISTFDKNGTLYKRHLGLGKGPYELESGHIHSVLPSGKHAFLADFGIWNYSSSYEKGKFVQIDWNCEGEQMEALEKNPYPDKSCSYGYKWGIAQNNPPFLSLNNERLIIPVSFEHPKMNAFQHKKYYEQTYLYGILNSNSGKIEQLLIKRPASISEKGILPNFDITQIALDNQNNILCSYATEPLIDVFSSAGELLFRFGVQGNHMNTDYPKTIDTDYEVIEQKGWKERENYGWYDGLYLDETNGYTFRNYFKGNISGENKYGIQIYDSTYTLISDLDLPVNCRIIGKIEDEYIASGIFKEDGTLPAFFKLSLYNSEK